MSGGAAGLSPRCPCPCSPSLPRAAEPAHARGLRACARGRAGRSAAPVGPRLPPGVGGGASPPRPAVPCLAGREPGSALRLLSPVWPRPRRWGAAAEARGRGERLEGGGAACPVPRLPGAWRRRGEPAARTGVWAPSWRPEPPSAREAGPSPRQGVQAWGCSMPVGAGAGTRR